MTDNTKNNNESTESKQKKKLTPDEEISALKGFSDVLDVFVFQHGRYFELKKYYINKIRSDVLLYDAYKGVSLSREILFNTYIEQRLSQNFDALKPIPLVIETFIMKTFRLYFRNKIDALDLVNPKCGFQKRYKLSTKFSPFKQSTLLYLDLNKQRFPEEMNSKGNSKVLKKLSEKKEMKKFPNVYAGTYPNVNYESLKTAQRELGERNSRLKKVERELDGFYTNNSLIHNQCRNNLNAIYKDPRKLT